MRHSVDVAPLHIELATPSSADALINPVDGIVISLTFAAAAGRDIAPLLIVLASHSAEHY